MNCKPGDLAVIVQSRAGNEGRIVRCVRLATLQELHEWSVRTDRGPTWWLETPIPHTFSGNKPFSADAALRPIRPGDISDEEVRDLYAPKLPEVA